jgi:hypothetical protein
MHFPLILRVALVLLPLQTLLLCLREPRVKLEKYPTLPLLMLCAQSCLLPLLALLLLWGRRGGSRRAQQSGMRTHWRDCRSRRLGRGGGGNQRLRPPRRRRHRGAAGRSNRHARRRRR